MKTVSGRKQNNTACSPLHAYKDKERGKILSFKTTLHPHTVIHNQLILVFCIGPIEEKFLKCLIMYVHDVTDIYILTKTSNNKKEIIARGFHSSIQLPSTNISIFMASQA